MADWLPDKWQIEIAIGKDGSKSEYYRHKETGQTFPTVGDMLRYVNYLRNEEPDVPNFKKHFMNDDGTIFVERPWEKDTKHTMHDYIHGRVGKCKGMAPESSFAIATNAKMREKLDQKIKGKAPESSFSP
ncbi:hypothetical protein RHMOL_Rhmol01G0080300 [Rhododendron molle]|uniref:Uncharacterized protein n=2 Tax=Rhododendron molle TaxID=49168 RepID=A0ACC0PYY0_RHOML|nr:hypothetical protein RHMOL_Rhmol01G0080300 [Rhododendron molle]KAI8570964.1 hypothetical protein RHMOL_Rhmol01G0080300 [Rhododendron molle]